MMHQGPKAQKRTLSMQAANIPQGPDIRELGQACITGDLAAIDHFLDAGGVADGLLPSGFSPFHQALMKGHGDAVRLLAQRGADIGIRTRWGDSSLELCVKGNRADMLKLLMELGADVHEVDGQQQNLLFDCIDSLAGDTFRPITVDLLVYGLDPVKGHGGGELALNRALAENSLRAAMAFMAFVSDFVAAGASKDFVNRHYQGAKVEIDLPRNRVEAALRSGSAELMHAFLVCVEQGRFADLGVHDVPRVAPVALERAREAGQVAADQLDATQAVLGSWLARRAARLAAEESLVVRGRP